jgi:lipid II:glycine glycyltransferase (peptidoglycan interpeptide bridge formation enzyme)
LAQSRGPFKALNCVNTPYQKINPLEDPRWEDLFVKHPSASVFHSSPWIKALRETYGYQPLAITSVDESAEGIGAIVFCRVESGFTVMRLVLILFADHFEPLFMSRSGIHELLHALAKEFQGSGYRYIEVRPRTELAEGKTERVASEYWLHLLNLSPSVESLFSDLHKSCIQRKIIRAERDGVKIEKGNNPELLKVFFHLFVQHRRRLGLPPQPFEWFKNLAEFFGDKLSILVARDKAVPAGAVLTISHNKTQVYKYGCSDRRYTASGAMPLLMWRVIQEAKEAGFDSLDLGRSDLGDVGLVTFKDRLGAEKRKIKYLRFGNEHRTKSAGRVSKVVFSHMPEKLLIASGRFLYKHIG